MKNSEFRMQNSKLFFSYIAKAIILNGILPEL